MPRARSCSRIIGVYLPDRSSHNSVCSLLSFWRKLIQVSTRSLRVTGKSHLTPASSFDADAAITPSIGEASGNEPSRPIAQAVNSDTLSTIVPIASRVEFFVLVMAPHIRWTFAAHAPVYVHRYKSHIFNGLDVRYADKI